uniref:OCIA domain-containing protein 2 isoform X2 n=1 Tax=Doryrhamphus excisus TaxID=161450 RepID=UPI0025AE11F7|nr:OCIA domain-containing protein 2 isoform X2 [Doryrhamphus excisus]
MNSEASVRKENAVGSVSENREWRCPFGDGHIHREDVRKVWKECQEQSFWYRALPFSLGSMAITGALIYNDVWKKSKRFGPFPKLAVPRARDRTNVWTLVWPWTKILSSCV